MEGKYGSLAALTSVAGFHVIPLSAENPASVTPRKELVENLPLTRPGVAEVLGRCHEICNRQTTRKIKLGSEPGDTPS